MALKAVSILAPLLSLRCTAITAFGVQVSDGELGLIKNEPKKSRAMSQDLGRIRVSERGIRDDQYGGGLGKTGDKIGDPQYSIAFLYAFKAGLGSGTAAANLLTALSSSAPQIERIAGGKVAWLGRVGAGIEGATALGRRRPAVLVGKVCVWQIVERPATVRGQAT